LASFSRKAALQYTFRSREGLRETIILQTFTVAAKLLFLLNVAIVNFFEIVKSHVDQPSTYNTCQSISYKMYDNYES